MDDNVKKVLERVAEGVWNEWTIPSNRWTPFQTRRQCVFCCVAPDYEGGHDADCPTTLARKELEKNGY